MNPSTNPRLTSQYVFIACQNGAENIIKDRVATEDSNFRLAYSRPGFLTLKSAYPTAVWSPALPQDVFVRTSGHSLDKFQGESAEKLVEEIVERFIGLDWEAIHVWQRDIAMPGWHGFEPGRSALASMVGEMFAEGLKIRNDERSKRMNSVAAWNEKILDVTIVEPNLWWVGCHVADTTQRRWPGGVPLIICDSEVLESSSSELRVASQSQVELASLVSRAYLKIAEAVQWSRLPMKPGDTIVEIGSSPGGACQFLLERGMLVTGIDPAEMNASVASHKNFEHVRLRSLQVKRRFFSKFRWLVCDANVAPNYTLDAVEGIVKYPTTNIEGLLLTMKLSEWSKASEIDEHCECVKSWGYPNVMARQLAFNRREYCLAASKTGF